MDFESVYRELDERGTEQTRKIYRRHGGRDPMFGVKFADFKDLKKKIRLDGAKKGIDHDLARQLWATGNMDARVLAAMVADPARLSGKEARTWAEDISDYIVADAFTNLVAASPLADELMEEWTADEGEYHRRIGYGILNEKARRDAGQEDAWFLPWVDRMKRELQQSPNRAREGMNNCLIALGGRSPGLKSAVLDAADEIGPVEIDHGETECRTFIIADYVEKIWARKKARGEA